MSRSSFPLRRASVLAALLTVLGVSCTDTQEATKPTDPNADANSTTVVDGDVSVANVNGITVIVKRVPGAELAAGRLCIKGGVRNWTADTAGIEELALATAASGGTQKLDKDAFSRKLASMGSELGASANNDYSLVAMKAVNAQWDDTFGLLVDVFLHPALPAAEVELNRQRQLVALKRETEDPDGRLEKLVQETLYKGHPYANRAVGTLTSVAALKADQLEPHLQTLRETSRLVFVAVGDISPDHVIDQVRAAFGALPRGTYVDTALPGLSFAKAMLTVDVAQLDTNYVEAAFPGPGWKDADFPAGLVGMDHLAERLFEEVRTKRNLSYAPSAHLSPFSAVPLASLYVSAVDPNAALKVMYDEAHRLQTTPMSAKDLAAAKSTFLTGLLMQSESMDGQARLLANAQIFGGDWKEVRDLPDRIRGVTAAQVQAFAQKYIVRPQVELVGDPAKLDPALATSL